MHEHVVLLNLTVGSQCHYQNQLVHIRKTPDVLTAVIQYEDSGALTVVPIEALQPVATASREPMDTFVHMEEEAYSKAQRRLEILQPLLTGKVTAARVAEIALAEKIGSSTLRRWLTLYRKEGSVLALVEKTRTGGKGRSRLDPEVEAAIKQVIIDEYLTKREKAPAHVYEVLKTRLHGKNVKLPTDKTLRARIAALAPQLKVERRLGWRTAKEQFAPVRPNTLEAPHPLAVVQLDHALLNIVLVDEKTRLPMSRPWLTIATDMFSRMVVGIHLAFEEPGAGGTGLCLAHSILPKEAWLSERGIQGEWPCWGVMETLHLDNAREFHGTMLRRASELYKIRLSYRPPRRPEYGGHVERLIRTIKFNVRQLAGALNVRARGRRRLVVTGRPTFSLPELECWLATYLVNVYHHREHKSLGISPYECYQLGVVGIPGKPGIGHPPRYQDEKQVRLDFMPFVKRSIQRYGVRIDHLHYYSEVLRPFIHSQQAGDKRSWEQFVFKRDPRNISVIYFLHPTTQRYHDIPLGDMKKPAISLWEYRELVRRELDRNPDRKRLTADGIFKGLARLKEIEEEAVRKTGKVTKAARRLRQVAASQQKSGISTAQVLPAAPANILPVASAPPIPFAAPKTAKTTVYFANALPFDDLYDGASDS